MNLSLEPWTRLARRAAQAPNAAPDEIPLGFATRVVANWQAQTAERALNLLEAFTWRGVAVAGVIVLGCVALGYDALSGFISGDTSLPEDLMQSVSSLIP